MRHVFIVNPAAGKGQPACRWAQTAEAYCRAHAEKYCIFETAAPLDAQKYVQGWAYDGEPVRFYACGGDGTLAEVATGARHIPAAEVACVPCGSANDYVRTFGSERDFRNIEALICGETISVDAIDCNGQLSLDICAMGMDANVAYKMTRYKNWPLISGTMAYQLAIADCFVHRIGCDLRVSMELEDGSERVEEGRFFFSLAACGQYYGGGYRGAPAADPTDGLLDFVLIEAMSRLRIPAFLKKYKRGQHMALPVCRSARGRRMRIQASRSTVVTVDGECFHAEDVTFSLIPQAVRFVLPAGLEWTRQMNVKKL